MKITTNKSISYFSKENKCVRYLINDAETLAVGKPHGLEFIVNKGKLGSIF
jgi:hypothetical protein